MCISTTLEPYSSVYSSRIVWYGSFAGLANRHETPPQLAGDRRSEKETARFDADDQVGLERVGGIGQGIDDFTKGIGVRKNRGHILEKNPGLRKVGNVADEGAGEQKGAARSQRRATAKYLTGSMRSKDSVRFNDLNSGAWFASAVPSTTPSM